MKVHLVTLALWGFVIAVVLFVWLFPKVILFLGLMVLAAFFYAKLYGIVERKLAEMEPFFADDDEPTPPPKRAKKNDTELDLPTSREPAMTAAPDLDADD